MAYRISDSMRSSQLLYNMYNVMGKMDKVSEQLTTLKKVNRPSDDPLAIARILRFKNGLNEMTQYDSNTKRANSWLTLTDAALDQAGSMVQRARELAVQMSNGTYSEDQRQNASKEIDQLLQGAVDISNASSEGKYLFGGFRSNKAPYTLTSYGANMLGNTGDLKTEIAQGTFLNYNVSNNRAFLLSPKDPPLTSTSAQGGLTMDAGVKGSPNSTVSVRISGLDTSGNPIRLQADLGDGYWREIDVPWSTETPAGSYPISVDLGDGFHFALNGAGNVGDVHRFNMDASGQLVTGVASVRNEQSGIAAAAFTGVGRTATQTFNKGDTITFHCVVDGKDSSFVYTAENDGETTQDIRKQFDSLDGTLNAKMAIYGQGDTPPWRTTPLNAGELIFAMKPGQEGKPFDFWASTVQDSTGKDISTTVLGTMQQNKVSYVPETSFIETVPSGPVVNVSGTAANSAAGFAITSDRALSTMDDNGLPTALVNSQDISTNFRYTDKAGVIKAIPAGAITYTTTASGSQIDFNTTGIAPAPAEGDVIAINSGGTNDLYGVNSTTGAMEQYRAQKYVFTNGKWTLDNSTQLLTGNYAVSFGKTTTATPIADITSSEFVQNKNATSSLIDTTSANFTTLNGTNQNASILLQVTSVDPNAQQVSFEYKGYLTATNGTSTYYEGTIGPLSTDPTGTPANNIHNLGIPPAPAAAVFQIDNLKLGLATNYTVGDKIAINAKDIAAGTQLQNVTLGRDGFTNSDFNYTLDSGYFDSANNERSFRFFQLNTATGESQDAVYNVKFSKEAWDGTNMLGLGDAAAGTTNTVTNAVQFEVKTSDVQREKDIFSSLADFRDALNTDDLTGVSNAIDEMARGLDNILFVRADVGARVNRLETNESRITDNSYTLEKMMSELEDTDIAKSMMDLKNQEIAYKTLLSMGAKTIQPSLLDFLR